MGDCCILLTSSNILCTVISKPVLQEAQSVTTGSIIISFVNYSIYKNPIKFLSGLIAGTSDEYIAVPLLKTASSGITV
jgi:hypothetical protein